jgi:23S rRNA (guanine2445-N2)-methyltransferase / 23S rRNA (guanine2069-N7)-methyltransferase
MQELKIGQTQELFAACPKGVEQLLADEIRQLGGEVVKENHLGVRWLGDLELAYRFCLWTRLATRLLLPLKECQVDNVDQMYDVAYDIPWNELFTVDNSIRIDFHGKSEFVNNTQFGAQKIKDAICDRFRSEVGARPDVSKDADVKIEVQLRRGRLAISLNFAGDSLHKRGYRLVPGKAPLKENLAAALLIRAGWPERAAKGENLLDPMCGSGTLLIEGLLMAADVAPGLNRRIQGFETFKMHDRSLWQGIVEEARQRRTDGLAKLESQFFGYDSSPDQIEATLSNFSRAGTGDEVLDANVQIQSKPFQQLWLRDKAIKKGGLIICNPPYGERLSELPQLAPLYQDLNEVTAKVLPQWGMAMITGNVDLAHSVRRPLHKKYSLFNGAIQCTFFVFDACDERSKQEPGTKIKGPIEAFANRLKKNLKPLRKWAKREDIHCYRIYDADLPEYSVAIDMYNDWLHVQEYVAPKSINPEKAERRLLDILAVLPEVTGIAVDNIVLKRRERQSGKKQYQRRSDFQQEAEARRMEVIEGNAKLWVNLQDYLDTGLFLDHRPTRLKIASMAKGQRFLNLFCYTATASVHAAVAGAKTTTSVDLSKTYLAWAEDNFRLNGMLQDSLPGKQGKVAMHKSSPWGKVEDDKHKFIEADCREWLKSIQDQTEEQKYDLIFMDPPTFSNSKKMEGILDIQRDHVELISLAMARLTKHGLLIFSTNLRKFDIDESALKKFTISNVSSKSVPNDFSRRANIHHCFEIKHAKKK